VNQKLLELIDIYEQARDLEQDSTVAEIYNRFVLDLESLIINDEEFE